MHEHHAEKPRLRRMIFSSLPSGAPSFLLACGILGAFGLIAATLSPWLTVGSLLPFASVWIWCQPRLDVDAVRTQREQDEQDGQNAPHAIVVEQWADHLQSYLFGLPILRTQLNETTEQIERAVRETGHRLSGLAVGIEAMREHFEHVQRIVKKIGIERDRTAAAPGDELPDGQNTQNMGDTLIAPVRTPTEEIQRCTEQALPTNQDLAEEIALARVEVQYYATINQRLAHIADALVELEYGLLAEEPGRGLGQAVGQAESWAKRLEQRFTDCVEPWGRPAAISRTGSDGQAQAREQQDNLEGDVGLL